MEQADLDALVRQLHDRRQFLLRDVRDTEADLRAMASERAPELEEEAQEHGITRIMAQLGDRDRQEIEDIAAALDRVKEGTYGLCLACGEPIPPARLRVLPTTELCVGCASERERQSGATGRLDASSPRVRPEPTRTPPTPDLDPLADDDERTAARQERLRADAPADGSTVDDTDIPDPQAGEPWEPPSAPVPDEK
jgi:RNA polymerase-binding protein DksA